MWRRLRETESPGAIVFRASTLPARIGALFASMVTLAEDVGGFAHATIARGIVRCVIPAPSDQHSLAALLQSIAAIGATATIVGERMPAPFWASIARDGDSLALAERIRKSFDPDRVMNPGVLGAP